MPSTSKAPEDYSKNPNTIRARQRKERMQGAQKIEEAAKTADYKALIHTRNAIRGKPEYQGAPETVKKAMMEEAMRDTMEKRRAKGQDTCSKMVAYHSGNYSDRSRTREPDGAVPIMGFLKSNGYVPPASTSAPTNMQNSAPDTTPGDVDSAGSAPLDPHNEGMSTTFHTGDGYFNPQSPPAQSATYSSGVGEMDDHNVTGAVSQSAMTDMSGDVGQSMPPPAHPAGYVMIKRSSTPNDGGALSTITPEVGDTQFPRPSLETGSSLRSQVQVLQSVTQHLLSTVAKRGRELDGVSQCVTQARSDVGLVRAELTLHKARVDSVENRVGGLETGINGITVTTVPRIQDQVRKLEDAVNDLQNKVGAGAVAEIAKMREVMRTLQNALNEVGGY